MRKIKVELFYPGSVITSNHMYGKRKGGGFYLKQEAKSWGMALGLLIKVQTNALLDGYRAWRAPLRVTISGRFLDKNNQPDLHNLKLIPDVIEDVTGVNDKYIQVVDGEVQYGEEPMLFITIEEVRV